MAVCNVQYLRFAELVSWYMAHPELPFPTAYVTSILEFCRANNLKLFWTRMESRNIQGNSNLHQGLRGHRDRFLLYKFGRPRTSRWFHAQEATTGLTAARHREVTNTYY